MPNFVIADNQAKANRAAQARGWDVIVFLPNKKESADRLRGVESGSVLVTNVKVEKQLAEQLRLMDRGRISFGWVAI